MKFPKNLKYFKKYKNKKIFLKGDYNKKSVNLQFGSCGLQALENGFITPRQIEAVRRTIVRQIKKAGRVWIGIFPDMPVTKKPLKTRMGRGKGNFNNWVSNVRKGRVLFEIIGIDKNYGSEVLQKTLIKLPIKVQIIIK